MTSHIAAVVVLTFAFLVAGIDGYAATLVVTKTTDTADGICDSDCSLREAVVAAASGDTVVFSSLFNEPQTITLTIGQIVISRNLTVTGSGKNVLTLSGNNASRVFRMIGGSTVSITGMKLTNGLASGTGEAVGGAIYQTGGSLTLTNMNVSNNVARQANNPMFGAGGGIFVDACTLSVFNSSISNNVVPSENGRGGGILATGASSILNITSSFIDSNAGEGIYGLGIISVIDSTIVGNAGTALSATGHTTVIGSTISNNGGGIGSGDGPSELTVDRSVISGNQPLGGVGSSGMASISNSVIRDNSNNRFGAIGGGLGNFGTMYVTNTSILDNYAFESAGGVYNAVGTMYLTNCTVSGNRAGGASGGGIYNGSTAFGGTLVLTNVTVANNTVAGRGGGIYHDNTGTVTIRNSIIADNISSTSNHPDMSGDVSSQGYNLITNTVGSFGWINSDLLNRKALLAPIGNNGGMTWTHAILPGSPGINAGNNDLARDPANNTPLTHDQRGCAHFRVVGGTVDIGAYEANYAAEPVTLSGRVVATVRGRGVSKAVISITDTAGNITYTQTNPFGFYRFLNLFPGTTYTIRTTHKSYQFVSPQVVTIEQPRDNLDFVAIGQ